MNQAGSSEVPFLLALLKGILNQELERGACYSGTAPSHGVALGAIIHTHFKSFTQPSENIAFYLTSLETHKTVSGFSLFFRNGRNIISLNPFGFHIILIISFIEMVTIFSSLWRERTNNWAKVDASIKHVGSFCYLEIMKSFDHRSFKHKH